MEDMMNFFKDFKKFLSQTNVYILCNVIGVTAGHYMGQIEHINPIMKFFIYFGIFFILELGYMHRRKKENE